MSKRPSKYSVSMPRDLAQRARERSGPSGLSAYIAAAVARQLERDDLNELIAVAEAEHGQISAEEIEEKRQMLRRSRERRAADDAA